MLKELDYVIAVAEAKSVHKAAGLLFISQPSLSRFISNLEKSLGLPLFRRTQQGMELTKAGEIYLRYAKEMKSLHSSMRHELRGLAEQEKTHIRVGMSLNSSSLAVNAIRQQMADKYPACQVEIFTIETADTAHCLLNENYDFFLGDPPVDTSVFSYKQFRRDSMVLLTPRSMDYDRLAENRGGFPFPWLDLSGIELPNLILQNKNCVIYREIMQLFSDNAREVVPSIITNNSLLAIQGTERQLGCCIISTLFLSYIAQPRQVRCYSIGPADFSTTGIVTRRGKVLTVQEQYCIRIMKQVMQSELETSIQRLRVHV